MTDRIGKWPNGFEEPSDFHGAGGSESKVAAPTGMYDICTFSYAVRCESIAPEDAHDLHGRKMLEVCCGSIVELREHSADALPPRGLIWR